MYIRTLTHELSLCGHLRQDLKISEKYWNAAVMYGVMYTVPCYTPASCYSLRPCGPVLLYVQG